MNAHYKMHLTKKSNPISATQRKLDSAFQRSGYRQFNSVNCVAIDDKVTLTGQLDTFYLSQMAQSIASKVDGVASVVNKINVEYPF